MPTVANSKDLFLCRCPQNSYIATSLAAISIARRDAKAVGRSVHSAAATAHDGARPALSSGAIDVNDHRASRDSDHDDGGEAANEPSIWTLFEAERVDRRSLCAVCVVYQLEPTPTAGKPNHTHHAKRKHRTQHERVHSGRLFASRDCSGRSACAQH
jgi:hypothetical protein